MGPVEVSLERRGSAVNVGELVSVTVRHGLNRIPSATIVLRDSDIAEQSFQLSDSECFELGTELAVKAGYGGDTAHIFEGIIVRQKLRTDQTVGTVLELECRDQAYLMTLDKKNACYVNKSDDEVMTQIVSHYSQLSLDVSDTQPVYTETVQYDCSDWDYILSRAQVNGQVVIVNKATLSIKPPESRESAALQLTYGLDIIEFDTTIVGRTQRSFAKLARLRQPDESLAQTQGSVTFAGNADARVGQLIKLDGVGGRSNGEVYVSGVEHSISAGQWITVAQFGHLLEGFIENDSDVAPAIWERVSGISGLHTGVVKKISGDPADGFRVQVTVPTFDTETDGIWARICQFYASNQFGVFFMPEIGDEVIVGFVNSDTSRPVILGSVYSSKQPPPYEHTTENNTKAFITRSKLKIEFDDDQQTLTVCTPTGNQLVLNENDQSVTLEDQNNNCLKMSEEGIELSSPSSISFKADGDVTINAGGNLELAATGDANVEGLNVSCTAKTGFTAKGAASAELSASGETTVKGAMVMIN